MFDLPTGVFKDNLIDHLRIVSWEASEILLNFSQMLKSPVYKKEIITSKNNEDPVTLADLNVNNLIIQSLNNNFKDFEWNILSEENVKIKTSRLNKITNTKWLWVLDPLDGTRDFIQGTGNYAMHLALNYRNKPYIGIVLIPERNELWISDGEKVICETKDGSTKDIKFSRKKNLNDMTIVTSKNHRNENLEILINKINFKEKIIMGSIGCKIASILRGESDIYICLSMPGKSCPKDWDFAAPEAILKAAGGAITNLDNEELSYNKSNFNQGGVIIASNNKQSHSILCRQIKELIEKHDIYPLLN
ncbi:MAG: 3'(2'),5'-bisphosphate nucleotidase CysQ [Prochlorococcus marinus CUG1438]|nr:3'(2'),5'-bisphosphate nucleotidase CysQ [Prochlorococcus marinus CUG1438]